MTLPRAKLPLREVDVRRAWMVVLVACSNTTEPETPVPSVPVSFCSEGPTYRYAPDPADFFTTFPDAFWTVADPATATGLRVALHPDEVAGLDAFPENFVDNFEQVTRLDGFGLTTPVVFQFTEDVSTLVTEADVVMLARTAEGDVDWPFTLRFEDSGRSVFVQPLVPLPAGTRVGVGVAGTEPCLVPSRALRAQLTSGDDAVAVALQDDVAAAGVDPADVGAFVGFTTQSATDQSVAAADWIDAHSYTLDALDCEDDGDVRICAATLVADDFRDPEGVVPQGSPTPQGTYDLPVHVWLPTTGGPFPTVVCGHGLGGEWRECDVLVSQAVPLGVAVVAIDALEHGEHPAQTDVGLELLQRLAIFAISVTPPGVSSLRLRDNFRQSAWDKLMVVRAIEGGIDVDGDGAADLDPTRMAYVGASLGGLMGPEPGALTDAFDAVVLIVAGGQVTRIIEDSDSFGDLVSLLAPPEWDDGDLARTFPLLQTAVDGGDPAVFARHLATDRLRDDHAPHVLLLLALNDTVVPNSTNDVLARALDLPGLGEEVWPVDGIAFEPGPFSANLSSGATGALLQFDQLHIGGVATDAQHGNVHRSDEARVLIEEILRAVRDEVDPVLTAPGG